MALSPVSLSGGIMALLLQTMAHATQNPTLIFDGGFESGDESQWAALHHGKQGRDHQFCIVNTPVREGRHAARLTVHNNDKYRNTSGERCDLLRPEKYDEKEGDDYWYAWSTLFPEGWQAPLDWFVIADWHSRYAEVCQLLQIEVTPGNALIAKVLTGNVSNYHCFDAQQQATAFSVEKTIAPKLQPGLWNDFIIHVRWTAKPQGIIEIYYQREDQPGYKKVVDLRHIPTLQYQGDPARALSPYFKLAHYRSDRNTHTSTLYHDGFRQGKTPQSIVTQDGLYKLPPSSKGKPARISRQADESSPSGEKSGIKNTTHD